MSENLPEKTIQTSPILNAALNSDLDIEKIERLYALHEKALEREAKIKYSQDMSKVQAEIPPIQKTKFNNHTKSWYAPLDEVNAIIVPIYSKYGFSVSFSLEDSTKENHIKVILELSHKDGYTKYFPYDAPLEGVSMHGKVTMTPTHGKSSTLSYSKRYLLGLAFNLSAVKDDNDGNGDLINDDQKNKLISLINETESSMSKFLKYYNISKISQLRSDFLSGAIEMLEIKKKNNEKRDLQWWEAKIDEIEKNHDEWWNDNKKQAIQDLSPDEFSRLERLINQYKKM